MRRGAYALAFLLGLLSLAQVTRTAGPRPGRAHVRVLQFSGVPRDWPQFNFDARHSGENNEEPSLGPDTVAGLQLLFRKKLPAISDGSPVLWANNRRRRASHYLFLTATNGTLMATDGEGNLRWTSAPPDGPRWTTSSPALDPSRQWVYSYALDGRVHKYAVVSGEEDVSGGWPVLVTRKPDVEKESAALSIATWRGTSYLYVTFAGYPDPGDAGDYQGHVVAIRLPDAHTNTFNALCSHHNTVFGYGDCGSVRAGVWARPGVVYNEADESVYVVTSNGSFTANAGGTNWGDSILRLPGDLHPRHGKPLDSYTPEEFEVLDTEDLDLGSSGLALVARPGESLPTLGVHAGKDSIIRVVDLRNLSGQGGPGFVGGELQRLKLPQDGYNLATPAVRVDDDGNSWLYFANDRGISALEMTGDADAPRLVERWRNPDAGTNSSPVVVNGLVFVVRTGRISALDAETGQELWFDTHIGPIHWQSPIVINGAVYVTDLDGMLAAYALPDEFYLVK